jgi:hypothetical protein
MFWNDLAFAHNGKEENPTNVPQIRPIEYFWAN